MFHLSPRFITFGGRFAHLAYHMYKSSRKTSIIIIFIIFYKEMGPIGDMLIYVCVRSDNIDNTLEPNLDSAL